MGQGKDSGVWGHSGEHGSDSYVIFAIDDQSPAAGAHFRNFMVAQGIGFKPLIGCYKGVTEQSYIINEKDWPRVAEIGVLQNQESILIVGPCTSRDRRPAKLDYLLDGVPSEDLGTMRSVPEAEAKAESSWTYDPHLKEYFICKHEPVYRQCGHCGAWSNQ